MNRSGFAASALLRGLIFSILLACAGQAAAQAWTQLSPTGGPPAARAQQNGVFSTTNNRFIVFGGFDGSCSNYNDTWVLSNADGTGGTPAWTQLSPTGGPPAAREGHMTAYNPNSNTLVTYGAYNCGSLLGDVWTLSNADGTGGTPVWSQLSPTGGGPGARGFATTVFAPASDSLIVFGGYNGGILGDVWVLSHGDGNGGTPAWTQLSPTGSGPARAEHSAVYDAGSNSMIVFGGIDGSFYRQNDVWVLSHADGSGGTPAWTQLAPTGTAPSARVVQSAVYDPVSGGMVVFGGGDNIGYQNDVWVLSHANGSGGTPAWTQLAPTGGPPAGRFGHAAGYNAASNSMTIFGGFNNSGLLNDTWVLSSASGVTTIPVGIAIRPNRVGNTISLGSTITVPVTILSSANFDATKQVNRSSLTFGHSGSEHSLASCQNRYLDVNGDGRLDLTCTFNVSQTGFVIGDKTGYLQGLTTVGNSITGNDAVSITK